MGIQLDTLGKQSLGNSNALQKALVQLDGSLADRGFATDDVIEQELDTHTLTINSKRLSVKPSTIVSI